MNKNEFNLSIMSATEKIRGCMDANEFKHFVLPLLFYKYLSDKSKKYYKGELLESKDNCIKENGFFVSPDCSINSIVSSSFMANDRGNLPDELTLALNNICDSFKDKSLANIFGETNFNSTLLGSSSQERADNLYNLLSDIQNIKFQDEADNLGDAYEYLISQFASNAGKKAGEFYTPMEISKLLAELVKSATGKSGASVVNIYDPTCGSGSLLIQAQKVFKGDTEDDTAPVIYGQEKNQTTYNLARMNMLMHQVGNSNLYLGDTLRSPKHSDNKQFDAIVANPPFSISWDNSEAETDDRFANFGGVAPQTKADFAFLQHMIHNLSNHGKGAVVLPHGVLFRGASEGRIRKYLIEKGHIEAVIGLPSNLFFGTSIPTCIIIFNKGRVGNKDILFIDASQDFEKGKRQNSLKDEHINKILDVFKNRETKERFSHLASLEEIERNDYNLNIARYVDMSEPEEEIDLTAVKEELKKLKDSEVAIDEKIHELCEELKENK